MIRTKKYAARIRVSAGVIVQRQEPRNGTIVYITVGSSKTSTKPVSHHAMNHVRTPEPARTACPRRARRRRGRTAGCSTRCARRPFEDLGFARVDHHRAHPPGVSRGHPRPRQDAGPDRARSPAEIVGRGSTLLVTRATRSRLRRRARPSCPAPTYHPDAARHHASPGRRRPGQGHDRRRRRRHLRPAGRRGGRADRRAHGQRRSTGCTTSASPASTGCSASAPASRPRASSSSSPAWKARCPASSPGLVQRAGHRGADQRRLRRQLRRHRRAARDAEQLRVRRVGRQHRQRLRRGQYRQPYQSLVGKRLQAGLRLPGDRPLPMARASTATIRSSPPLRTAVIFRAFHVCSQEPCGPSNSIGSSRRSAASR